MTFLRELRVRRRPNHQTQAVLVAGNRTIICALGRSGTTVFKREGDGGTPAFRVMRPLSGYFRGDRILRPFSKLPFRESTSTDGWCDAPDNPNYNMPVKLPFGASHETMMRDDVLYNICVVLDWNMPIAGRKRFAGSAIFLHLCKPNYQPTEGCIAIEERDMRWLLPRINAETCFIVER